jgi:hypothetical protein
MKLPKQSVPVMRKINTMQISGMAMGINPSACADIKCESDADCPSDCICGGFYCKEA